MSVGAAPSWARARARGTVRDAAHSSRVPLRAFAVSRVIVVIAGAAGALAAPKHDAAAASVYRHALGPLGYLLTGSVDRFDSGFYLYIAHNGYGAAAAGRLAFFPLYPVLIRLLTPVTGSGVMAGFLISSACFLAALTLLHRLTELELGRRAADATVLLLAFAPLSFFFTAIYTESLMLALSVGAVLAARQGRWRLACALGALATLARPTGVLLGVALVVMRVRTSGRVDRGLLWTVALPVTLVGYLAVLVVAGYRWLAPFAAEATWGRVTAGPISGLAAGVWAAVSGAVRIAGGTPAYHPTLSGPFSAAAESIVLLAVLVIAGAALAGCLRRLPLEYGAFAGVMLLACLSSSDAGQPLWSFDRYTLTIFPLWMAAGAWVSRRRLALPAVVLGSVMLVFYTVQFSSWAFVA